MTDHPSDDSSTPDPAADGPAGDGVTFEPRDLPLDELREMRNRLQRQDDVVSYVRRVAQARLDLVRAEISRRERGESEHDLSEDLRTVLSQQLTGGPARPPRPTDDPDAPDEDPMGDDPIADELDIICVEHGFSRLTELDDAAAARFVEVLADYERRISANRRDRFDRLDALSAELVRRYREGEASVDTLLGEF